MAYEDALNYAEEYDYDDVVEQSNKADASEKVEAAFNDMSPEEMKKLYGEHVDCDGQVLVVESIKPMLPKTTTLGANGQVVKVDPILSRKKTSKYYEAKLQVKFNNNMVAYYPKIRYFLDDKGELQKWPNGKLKVTLDKNGQNAVAELMRKVLSKMSGIPLVEVKGFNNRTVLAPKLSRKAEFDKFANTIGDGKILASLIGKKVKIKTWRDTHPDTGAPVFRNDISEILD